MKLTSHFRNLLESIKVINEISFILKTKTFIWGGLTQDIYEGRFLREHSDVDCLMLNRNTFAKQLKKLFEKKGWQVTDMNGVLSIKKDGNKIHLGNIEVADNNLMKYTLYDGSEFISFPQTWLDQKPHKFYDSEVYATKPEFEYAIRVYPAKLNPKIEVREKDIMPIEYFGEILKNDNKNLNAILAKMVFSPKLIQE